MKMPINIEYQNKREERGPEVDETNSKSGNRSSGPTDSRETASLNLSRFRNSRVRTEVLRDLSHSASPRKNELRNSVRGIPVASPPLVESAGAGPAQNPVSPSKAKNVGVHIGFQLNMIVVTLKRVIDEMNADSKREFLHILRRKSSRVKSIEKLRALLERKRTNVKFHAFAALVNFSNVSGEVAVSVSDDDSPTQKLLIPTVLPLGVTHPLTTMQPYIHVTGNRLNRFAAVGRITGVLLSIIRIQKISFFNELIRLRFDKLYFIRTLS